MHRLFPFEELNVVGKTDKLFTAQSRFAIDNHLSYPCLQTCKTSVKSAIAEVMEGCYKVV
jgi:hypothetical protein